ncbi:MAG: tetratricopeptide repeat protein [Planctomycetaceae bacterium]
MMSPIPERSRVAVLTLLFAGVVCGFSGCASTKQTGGFSNDSQGTWAAIRDFGKPRNSSNYEEHIQEIPSQLQRPAELSLAYARAMEESGNYTDARVHYLKVLELRPNDVAAIVGIARVDHREGNLEAAERGYRKALTLDPSNADALHGLGRQQAKLEQWDSAVDSLNRAVLAAPNDTTIRYDLAVALVQTGHIDAALPHFIRTVGAAEANYNVGLILYQQGDLAGAEQQFRIAVARKPSLAPAQQWLDTVIAQQHSQTETSDRTLAATNFAAPSF